MLTGRRAATRSSAAALRAVLLGGCLAVAASCGVPPSSPAPPGGPSEPPSAVPKAGPVSRFEIEDLPEVEPNPATLTAVCDPEPGQADPEAGAAAIFCFDGVVLGLRAARTVTQETITRAYLRRPACAAVPCSPDALSTAAVVAWTDTGIVTIQVDSRLDTVLLAEATGDDPWPRPSPSAALEVRREDLGPAPAAIADRTPYPYCGRATYDMPAKVLACFRDSVLLGRPAEAIQDTFGTEGGEVLDIFRFDGAGAITRYERSEGGWTHHRGGLILGTAEGSWAFDPWGRGDAVE